MTTKGLTRRDLRGEVFRHLPERIARAEADGHPVIVEVEPPIPEEVQRLYATLGVLVRFKREPAA